MSPFQLKRCIDVSLQLLHSLIKSLSILCFCKAWNKYPSTKVLLICIQISIFYQKGFEMMNRCAYQQQNNHNNNNALVRGEEMMSGVVCPKPRRLCLLNPSIKESIFSTSSPRWQHHYPIHQAETRESNARTELLDMILTKECYGGEKGNNLVPSSPPFFCGSPPSRASNPVVQDAEFGNENPSPLSPAFEASPSSSARKNGGSCARGKFGQKHPAVRVEGFNCRGISAVA